MHGRLTRVAGLVMEAVGLKLPIGSSCVVSQDGFNPVEAEVVGFSGDRLYLMPASDIYGLTPGASVTPLELKTMGPAPGVRSHPPRRSVDRSKLMPVGEGLLGRIVDASGTPLDKLGPLAAGERRPLHARPINPLDRDPIFVHPLLVQQHLLIVQQHPLLVLHHALLVIGIPTPIQHRQKRSPPRQR